MITHDGIYGLTMDEYVKDPCIIASLNSGTINALLSGSPAHAWAQHPRLNLLYTPEEREDFDLGSAAHALLLEGEDRMVPIRADSYRTKAAQEARDAARAEGKHPILEAKYEEVFLMRDVALQKLANCPDLPKGFSLKDGAAEQSIIWREGETMFRVRPDWRRHDGALLLNYKTTAASAHPNAWARTMLGTGADVQATLELRGNAAIRQDAAARSIFLVQEVEAPYACSIIALGEAFREFASSKIDHAVEVWRECMKANTWPGYTNHIAYLDPPAWALTQHEELTAEGVTIP